LDNSKKSGSAVPARYCPTQQKYKRMKRKQIILSILIALASFVVFFLVFRNWDLLKECLLR